MRWPSLSGPIRTWRTADDLFSLLDNDLVDCRVGLACYITAQARRVTGVAREPGRIAARTGGIPGTMQQDLPARVDTDCAVSSGTAFSYPRAAAVEIARQTRCSTRRRRSDARRQQRRTAPAFRARPNELPARPARR